MVLQFRQKQGADWAAGSRIRVFTGALVAALTLLVGVQVNAAPSYTRTNYTPGKLNFNRTAAKLTTSQLSKLNGAHTGFRWNSGDNETLHWRPQGIAGYTEGRRKYLIVSWAGQGGYKKSRGARISVVDVTSMNNVKYRHVLLVDQGSRVFPDLHAGGITVRKGILHVAHSKHDQILTFDLSKIKKTKKTKKDSGLLLKHRYVLRNKSVYPSPVNPSFLSFDWSRDQFLVGSFIDKRAHDLDDPDTDSSAKLAWYSSSGSAPKATPRGPFYPQMQGAGADGRYLWTTHSWDRKYKSHLHVDCYEPGRSIGIEKSWVYPPGLEDIHISKSSDNIWMLTEFGKKEGRGNNRDVFATKRSKLKPRGGCNLRL